jgi:hypothetical protein
MEAPFLAGTPLGVPAMLDAACTVDMLNDAGLYAPGFAVGRGNDGLEAVAATRT